MSNTKNNKSIIYNKRNKERGAVLFIALTVSSLVLMIGIGMLDVMVKEMLLGSLSTQSREAFYAADSGVECAMHWDLIQVIDDKHPGAAGEYSTSTFPVDPGAVVDRNGEKIGVDLFTANKFNPFCAGQTADKMLDDYLWDYFRISEPSSYDAGSGIATTQFVFFPNENDVGFIAKPCVLVTVEKKIITASPLRVQTQIYSEGFSTCDRTDKRRVSRGVMVQYEI